MESDIENSLNEVEQILQDCQLVTESVCGMRGEIPPRLILLAVENIQARLEKMGVSSPCKTAMLGFDPPQRV